LWYLRLDIFFGKIYFHYSIARKVDMRREDDMDLRAVRMAIPEGCNIILGQAHFIKTIEDLYEIVVTAVPQAKFGIAFTEASGPCLIRTEGNEADLVNSCVKNLQKIGAGHVFCVLLKDAFPINILNQVKNCPEVCRIFCATANPLEVVVTRTPLGCGVLGVIYGFSPKGVEGPEDRTHRKEFLREIGYKL
jgi:adenosine/AMP kinase